MKALLNYLEAIAVPEQRKRMEEISAWLKEKFPGLNAEIKWNQPMFTDHGTFIIGFSMAKQHMAFTPEEAAVTLFAKDIESAGYEHTKGIVRIKWTQEVNYPLIEKMVAFNILDKADCKTFFR